jgi:hypothetical protein
VVRHSKFELVFRQRGAERCDGVGNPGLVERDDVHVALDRDDRAGIADHSRGRGGNCRGRGPCGRARFPANSDISPARRATAPAAEGDDPAPRILDRKHDAVAEPVEGDRDVVAEDDEAAGLDLVLGLAPLPARCSFSALRLSGA